MSFFDKKDMMIDMALKVSGVFDSSCETDVAAAYGAALGASLGSGQDWTIDDSLRLGAAISALDAMKDAD